jgi:hypothetical protein
MPKPKQKHKKSKKEGDKKFKRLPWQQVFYPNRQSTRDKEQIHKRLLAVILIFDICISSFEFCMYFRIDDLGKCIVGQ